MRSPTYWPSSRCQGRTDVLMDAEQTGAYVLQFVVDMIRDNRLLQSMSEGTSDAVAADGEARRLPLLRLE